MASNSTKSVGQNVELEVEDNILIIRIDLNERYGRSKSGKSITVASTQGNVSVPGFEDIKLGINCYTKD